MADILEFPTDVAVNPPWHLRREITDAERQRNHDAEWLAYLESCGVQSDQVEKS